MADLRGTLSGCLAPPLSGSFLFIWSIRPRRLENSFGSSYIVLTFFAWNCAPDWNSLLPFILGNNQLWCTAGRRCFAGGGAALMVADAVYSKSLARLPA